MAEPADPRLGSEIAGYRIEARIGRGGMGVVYRARHMNLQRRAAIKIIAPECTDTKGFLSRFIHEARIAAALQHPNSERATVPDSERRARMLLAGVEPSTRAIVQVAVGDRIEVELAGEGHDVVEAARDRHPDPIVLDWNAAGLATRDILEALRADPVTRGSQVLLIVRDKQTRSREVARADADETLATPFPPLQLQVKLRNLLGADAVAV
jgi:CheY-like chemotaxis protein